MRYLRGTRHTTIRRLVLDLAVLISRSKSPTSPSEEPHFLFLRKRSFPPTVSRSVLSLWRFSFATSSVTLLTRAPGKALALLAGRSWEKNLPVSLATSESPTKRFGALVHSHCCRAAGATSLVTALFLRLLRRLFVFFVLEGCSSWGGAWGTLRSRRTLVRAAFLITRTQASSMNASSSPPGEQAFKASPGGSALDRANAGGHATVIVLVGLCWGVDLATLDRIPSSSRCTCSLRELSSFWRSSVAASPAREWLASPLLAGVLSSIFVSKVLRRAPQCYCGDIPSLLAEQPGVTCGSVRPFFSTAQNMHLVKRVISAAQPASESMTHLFFLQWAQRNFCFSGPILTFLGSDWVSSQKVGVDCTIDNVISLCLPREMAHFLSLGCTSSTCRSGASLVSTGSFGVRLMRTWLRTPDDAGPARDVTPTLCGESTAYTFIINRRHTIILEFVRASPLAFA